MNSNFSQIFGICVLGVAAGKQELELPIINSLLLSSPVCFFSNSIPMNIIWVCGVVISSFKLEDFYLKSGTVQLVYEHFYFFIFLFSLNLNFLYS